MGGGDTAIASADAGERRELWKRLADERVAMLGTRDLEGTRIARPVMPVSIEPDGRVWLFTEADGDIAGDLGLVRIDVRRGDYWDASLADLHSFPIVVEAETDRHAWDATLQFAERCQITLYDAAYLESVRPA